MNGYAPIFQQQEWLEFLENYFGKKVMYLKENNNKLPFLSQKIAKGLIDACVSLPFGAWGHFPIPHNISVKTDIFIIYTTVNINSSYKKSITTFFLDISQNEENIWKNFTSRKRNDIRRAQKVTCKMKKISGTDAAIMSFELYRKTVATWKNPRIVYDKRYFELLFKHLGEKAFLCLADYKEGKAGIIILRGENILHYYFAFGDRNVYKYNPHSLLLWKICSQSWGKFKYIDLGPSHGNIYLEKFKMGFKPIKKDIFCYYIPVTFKGKLYLFFKKIRRN